MKRYLLILTLCGSVQAGSYDEAMENLNELVRQNQARDRHEEAMEHLEEIERLQEEILNKQRRLERDSTDYWGRPW